MPQDKQRGQAYVSAPAVPQADEPYVWPATVANSLTQDWQQISSQIMNIPVATTPVVAPNGLKPSNQITNREARDLRDLDLEPVIDGGVVTGIRLPTRPMTTSQELMLRSLVASPPLWLGGVVLQDIAVHLAIKRDTPEPKKETMLATILRLYKASMTGDVRSPLVHIVGPPGCGKSTSVQLAADLLGVNLHIVNVSRMSPLDIEGVQMPDKENAKLRLLTATWWTDLKDGDIVLYDEFLRGFPEVFNGLLDILTSRRVGAFHLPKVFFIAASNSVATYDKALEDRLLHITVADPRKDKHEKQHMAQLLVDGIGLHPDMADVKNHAMFQLLETEVLPMFGLLDQFKGKATVGGSKSIEGHSVRNLIGQARLRQIQSESLKELIEASNRHAESRGQWQYIVLPDGKRPHPNYEAAARKLVGNPKLTDIQVQNLEINLELIELEAAMKEEV